MINNIKISEYSTVEDVAQMSIPNGIEIKYGKILIRNNCERSKQKNLKKCLLELYEKL